MYKRYTDIPQFTSWGCYESTMPWGSIEKTLAEWKRDQTIDIMPDYQRGHKWNTPQQRRYVEYCLKGGRTARTLLWNCSSWMGSFDTPLELVDGVQRLQAVQLFMGNELDVFTGKNGVGSFYSDFEEPLHFSQATFTFHINNLKTRKEVLQWYIDLNSGGTVHEDSEIERVRQLLRKEK